MTDDISVIPLSEYIRVIQGHIRWTVGNFLLNPTGKPLIHKGRKP